jgi:threonine aldolase
MNTRTEPIDLRSDTVTKPTPEMRRAMYEAEVADDTYDGDPTVKRLQELAAQKTGKEAALFVVSGTMGNLLGALVNTAPGQEAILGDLSHIFLWEVGGIARIANLVTHTVPFHNGWLDPAEIEAVIRLPFREAATTGMIAVEDTSNIGGGAVIPPEHLAKIHALAQRYKLPVHMDGARVFNAATAVGRPCSDLCQYVDTVSFCLSKGLGAPFGAMLCGSRPLIDKAITYRQMLGGGMRQAGVMAAAGILALTKGADRLGEDHANARKLAEGLAERFPGCVDLARVETNMFHIQVARLGVSGQQLADFMRGEGIWLFPGDPRMRLTTHNGVSSQDIDTVLAAFDKLKDL